MTIVLDLASMVVVASLISLSILGWLQMTCVAKTFPLRNWIVRDYLARKTLQSLFFLNITQTDGIEVVFMFNISKLRNKHSANEKASKKVWVLSWFNLNLVMAVPSGKDRGRIVRMILACLIKEKIKNTF